MTALPTIDLSRIRDHAGAKDRGFEELAYLLAWDLEGLAAGTDIERRSTPDGGIEFSCIPAGRGNGGRWAWQAKYLFRFDKSTFAQMTKSVDAALDSTPDLERYIFVLPKDRSTAGISKWNDAVAAWTKNAKAKGMSVEFQFRGESEIIAAATRDEHAGAIRYFFDETFLTSKFIAGVLDRAVHNLGERYNPNVNVETGARDIIDAACRGARFSANVTNLLSAPANAWTFVGWHGSSEEVILDGGKAVETLLDDWNRVVLDCIEHLADPGVAVFRAIETHASRLRRDIEATQATIAARIEALSEQSERPATPRLPGSGPAKRKSAAQKAEDARQSRLDSLRTFDSSVWRLRWAVDRILDYLSGPEVAAAVGGSVLLVGEAGCGKSHLVADLATERSDADIPSFLILGQLVDTGLVDPQLVQMMGLGTVTLGDALQAIDVAARVRRKGRALLAIDAVNEGAGADVWEAQLPGLVAEVAKYPWIALVVTLRDVYEGSVLPGGLPVGMTRSVHRGLAGHEEEALTLYAAMYNLRLPDVPALLPEITNPLFLRSLCQSVQGRGLKEIPREAGSLVWVFDGLIEAVDRTLRRPARLNYADWERKVHDAVTALAAAMVDAGTESLPISDASNVCTAVLPHSGNSKSLLNGLIVEGLLLRERVDRDGATTDSVRFTYQRLSDHLRAEVILARHPTDPALAAAVRSISKSPRCWVMSGVISALVLLVPETRGKELATVLRFGKNVVGERWAHRNPSAWLRGVVQEAFFESLVWRSPTSITPATRDLLKRYVEAGAVEDHEWLRIVSALACVPSHPLNAEWLHPILWRMSLPERDQAWSQRLLWVYSDDVNPVSRIVDWAWATPDAPEEVVRLTSTFLAWLLTSPNRRLRDTATKALVSVTTHQPLVLADLVERFATVNDPYVIDRVVAAAYGHVLRRRHHIDHPNDIGALKRIGQATYDAVFGAGDPPAHLALRHRARTCARIVDDLCRAAGASLERDLTSTDPPYRTPWPLTAPSATELAQGFGRTYDKYLFTATEVDGEFEQDLERHVLNDFVVPDQEEVRSAWRSSLTLQRAEAVNRLVDGVAPSRKERVRRRAESLLEGPRRPVTHVRHDWDAFEATVPSRSKADVRDLRDIAHRLDQVDRDVFHPDADLCIRWIAARMLDLGWTKDRFGDSDGMVRTSRGRPNETERIAKKYERIAFQELCGHLADHCTIDRRWREVPVPYEGPWQIDRTEDIDPSLLVRGDQPDDGTSASRLREIRLREERRPAWWRTLADHQLTSDLTNDAWLGVTDDIPRPRDLITTVDPTGEEWVALERHQEWSIKDPSDLRQGYRRDRRQLWIRTQANIIRADDQVHANWAANTNWMGLRHLSTPADMTIDGLGEYPDRGAWPSELDLSDTERRPYEPNKDPGLDELPIGWELADLGHTTAPYALATVGWYLESERDYAAADTPGLQMPSRVMLRLLNAHWSGGLDEGGPLGLGPIEREYSWVADGEVVAFCAAERGYGGTRVLWARAAPLREALARAGLALWTWVLGEKIYWTEEEPSSDRTESFAAVQLAPAPTTVWGFTIEREHGRRRSEAGVWSRLLAERADGIVTTPMSRGRD